ncbi:MAG: hypothetical protein AAF125_21365, partial [Chloroflexota bacterium]
MGWRLRIILVLCGLMMVFGVGAQDVEETAISANRRTALHDGPGHTYFPSHIVNPGVPLTAVERNTIGNWVRVQQLDDDGAILQDGWTMLGFLNLPTYHSQAGHSVQNPTASL